MDRQSGVVESITEGGCGSEATVRVELRTLFPGLGGTLVTHEGVAAALRIERNPCPLSGHRMFLRHLVVKKLDDHFYRSGAYIFSHIPRVLGSISCGPEDVTEAYIYEWAFGSDGFSWVVPGSRDAIELREWGRFVDGYECAGIDLQYDTTRADDARVSQNIIHQYPSSIQSGELCSLWKRIDFGYGSVRLDADRLGRFVSDRRAALSQTLRYDRYEMLRLAVQYLVDGDRMSPYDVGRLEGFICDYRRSSLRHYAYGSGPAGTDVRVVGGGEALLGQHRR